MVDNFSDEEIRIASERFMRSLSAIALYGNLNWWANGNHEYNEKELNKAFEILDAVILQDYSDQFLNIFKKGMFFYRARIIDPEDYGNADLGVGYRNGKFCGYNSLQSKEPPKEIAKAGRLSTENEVALYLAEDMVTACCEVRAPIRSLISVSTFSLKEDLVLIDFSKLKYGRALDEKDTAYGVDAREFLSKVFALFTVPRYNVEEYAITQGIAKHFRNKGYAGFCYRSFYTGKRNFTFFDDAMKKFEWNESKVVINYATANLYVSLDETPDVESFNNVEILKKPTDSIKSSMRDECKKAFE